MPSSHSEDVVRGRSHHRVQERGSCPQWSDVSADGDEGLHLASSGTYDLIILDVMLPGRDGWSVINVVDVHVRRLRTKVDNPFAKKLIHTVRGVGYVLEDRG